MVKKPDMPDLSKKCPLSIVDEGGTGTVAGWLLTEDKSDSCVRLPAILSHREPALFQGLDDTLF
jgi:hypothetical protein